MLNVVNHQRNANQSHKILPHTHQNGYHQKEHKLKMYRKENPVTLLVGI